jgi:prenyltransferase beta subunit
LNEPFTRRAWLARTAFAASSLALTTRASGQEAGESGDETAQRAFDFILRCRRDDGGYSPSPDPSYGGNSDTKLSDLAAVTYAAVLARTLGRTLPQADRSIAFIQGHQQPDGRLINLAGQQDPRSDLAVLYNTTQGVVSLRALGAKPEIDPAPIVGRFIEGDAYKKLPWYTTSFFPLFYAALGKPFPDEVRDALAAHMERNQAEDGYVGDHVAAAFHMAHFYRLIDRPTPKADRMVARVLRDQKPDGGWNIKHPDWDVHACFDAVFILRQLGDNSEPVRRAIEKGADWAAACQNPDGGFGHFPGRHSDMDAVYFQLGTLIQAGRVRGVDPSLTERDAKTLGWGHAMPPPRASS